ncbi:hypothetical protein BX600DRAFT_90272 [Xylariales sp. PMI_506]|nr:hypothetical protein BX600DRAFT_90272 [Xylariales sp. PMI_506]
MPYNFVTYVAEASTQPLVNSALPWVAEPAAVSMNYLSHDFAMSYSEMVRYMQNLGTHHFYSKSMIGEDADANSQFSVEATFGATPEVTTSESTPEAEPAAPKKRRRKEITDPVQIDRRRLQNRQSQKAYRQRKDSRIRELEGAVEVMNRENKRLAQEMAVLRHASRVLRDLQQTTQAPPASSPSQQQGTVSRSSPPPLWASPSSLAGEARQEKNAGWTWQEMFSPAGHDEWDLLADQVFQSAGGRDDRL